MTLLDTMSGDLQLPVGYLRKVTNSASHRYKEYRISKKGSKGKRVIHHPSKELKALQRWLAQEFIQKWPVHGCATAYRKGRGVVYNARLHMNSSFLLRMDIQNFFPSIRELDVRSYVSPMNWSQQDVDCFASIVCRYGALTIGAPTSPFLSNAVCYELDRDLFALSRDRAITYSRYADDLFFSSNDKGVLGDIPDVVKEVLRNATCPGALRINHKKTRHSSRKGRRKVTGVTITCDGDLSVGRGFKRTIRSLIHQYDGLNGKEKKRLAGLLGYAQNVEPDLVNRLIYKYGVKLIQKVRRGAPNANDS